MMDRAKGWKTLVFNIVTLVVTITGALTGTITDPDTLRAIIFVQGAANLILRLLTDSAVPFRAKE